MAGEWRQQRWGDLATLEYGLALRGHGQNSGRFCVFGRNGPIGWHDEALCTHPGVIIGRKGAYRGVHYSPAPFFVIDTAFYLSPKTQIDLRWAYYELLDQDINSLDSGSAIPSTSRESFYSLRVRVPPLPKQRAIAHILGTLDDKIELNRRMSETLEAIARALFESWFVRFDPVRRNMERKRSRHPSPAASRHPLPRGEGRGEGVVESHAFDHLFPDRLVDSELGEIPEGLEVGTLGDVADQFRDHVNPLSDPASEFLHFSIPAFDEGQWPKLERGEEIKSQKWQVTPGVVLLSKLYSEIERVWLVDVKPDDHEVCSTEFLVFRPRPRYGRSFFYCLTRSPFFRQQIEGLVTGTSKSHQRAQPSAIPKLAAIKPPAPVVTAFDRTAAPLLDRTLECRRESRTLAVLRDALLPKLISGEIRMKDAERFVEEKGL